jgi:AcrR family transcriptional regulator
VYLVTVLRFADLSRALEDFLDAGDTADPSYKKRLRIVAAATELFIQHGYRKASVDAIARRAGMAKGTVYLYFKTKNELLIYAIAAEKKRYIEAIKPILDGELAPREKLRAYLRRAMTLFAEMPLLSRLMSGDREILAVLDDMDTDVRSTHEAMQIDFLSRLLDPAAGRHRWTAEELTDRARVMLALMYSLGSVLDERLRGTMSLERFGGVMADMLVDGLCPVDQSGRGGKR